MLVIEQMEKESEDIHNEVLEADEKLNVHAPQEIHALQTQTNQSRHEHAEIENEKLVLEKEAIDMRAKGIELQN